MRLVPTAVLSDADVANALTRAVSVINPVLDVATDADPFGLKDRTYRVGGGEGLLGRTADALAVAVNATRAPGTRAWERLSIRARVNWWVHRVGAVNTVFVAFPGIFGPLAARLPIQDLLGFSNQVIVLCGVARELGVTDYRRQVEVLAEVMCQRSLDAEALANAKNEEQPVAPSRWGPLARVHTLWRIAGILRAMGAELDKRPQPKSIFRKLRILPVLGAPIGYLGEYGALRRAARAAVRIITEDPASDAGAAPIIHA